MPQKWRRDRCVSKIYCKHDMDCITRVGRPRSTTVWKIAQISICLYLDRPWTLSTKDSICCLSALSILICLACKISIADTVSTFSMCINSQTWKLVLCKDANEITFGHGSLILKSGRKSNIPVNNVQKWVEALELSISEIEKVPDSIFQCSLKARISLLNSLNYRQFFSQCRKSCKIQQSCNEWIRLNTIFDLEIFP